MPLRQQLDGRAVARAGRRGRPASRVPGRAGRASAAPRSGRPRRSLGPAGTGRRCWVRRRACTKRARWAGPWPRIVTSGPMSGHTSFLDVALDRAPPDRRPWSSSRATARGASGTSARSPRPPAGLAGTPARARRRARRRRPDAGRQPARVGAHDGRLLPASAPSCCPCTEQLRAKDLRLRLEGHRAARWSSPTSATRDVLAAARARRARGAVVAVAELTAARAARRRPTLERRRPVPDHVHLRAPSGEPQGACCTAQRYLAGQRAAGRALARRPRPASSSGARPRPAGRSRRATSSSPRGCAARRRCCTTRASTRTSGSSCSSASA